MQSKRPFLCVLIMTFAASFASLPVYAEYSVYRKDGGWGNWDIYVPGDRIIETYEYITDSDSGLPRSVTKVTKVASPQSDFLGGNSPTNMQRPSIETGVSSPAKSQVAKPASNANTASDDCQSNPMTKHPVIIATGEKVQKETDFITGGSEGMTMRRTYRSFNSSASMFGPRWISTYDYPALAKSGCFHSPDYPKVCLPTTIYFTDSNGATYTYTQTASQSMTYMVNNSSATGVLYNDGPDNGYRLFKDKRWYDFLPNGTLQEIHLNNGMRQLKIDYAPNSRQPIRVTNVAGQYISFTWSSGHVVKTTDASGGDWSYAYTSNGLLSTVTSPGANPDVRQYFYEDATDNSLLTGIAINGVRYSTYAYDGAKRVIDSGLAGGEERETFVYGANQTTVTNATGESETYTFVSAQGGLKLSGVSRAPTSTCATAASQTSYDANGWMSSQVDWNGNRTTYSFDVNGKLLSVTTAAGTGAALTEVNSWSGDDLIATEYRDSNGQAYRRVTYAYIVGPAISSQPA